MRLAEKRSIEEKSLRDEEATKAEHEEATKAEQSSDSSR